MAEEKATIVDQGEDVSKAEIDNVQNILERCNDTQRTLLKFIHEIKDYIDSTNKLYIYCIQCPTASVNYKVKDKSIESKLSSIGKTFDVLSGKDGS